MNILMYAENYIFKVASSPAGEGILEGNREQLYQLYNYALQLEPDAKPELTFSERMIVNKARGFITKRMKRRAEIRNLKQSKKADRKMKKMMSDKIFEQFKDQLRAQQEKDDAEQANPTEKKREILAEFDPSTKQLKEVP